MDNVRTLLLKFLMLPVMLAAGPAITKAQQPVQHLPFPAKPLLDSGDLTPAMVSSLDVFLTDFTRKTTEDRSQLPKWDFSGTAAFEQSVSGRRDLLLQRLGATDQRVSPAMEILTGKDLKPLTIEKPGYNISAVRWNVLEGLQAEGILITPKIKTVAFIVLIPDADMEPEQFAGLSTGNGAGIGVAKKL